MSTLTTNYSFIKNARGEFGWDVDQRANWDSLDSTLKTVSDEAANAVAVVALGAIASGTATSVGTLTISDTGASWATNVFAPGYSVRYLSGGLDAVAAIASNTATQLTLASGSSAPDAATAYTVFGVGTNTTTVTTITTASGTVTMTAAQLDGGLIVVSSTLTGNLILQCPSGYNGDFKVRNDSTGAYSVTVEDSASTTSYECPRGMVWPIVVDGTNVWSPNSGQVVQTVHDQFTGHAITTSYSSTPTSSDGYFLFATTFTPKFASSNILIRSSDIQVEEQTNFADNMWVAVFAHAILTDCISGGTRTGTNLNKLHAGVDSVAASWGLFAATIRVNAGADISGTVYINGSGTALAGAYNTIRLEIQEVAP